MMGMGEPLLNLDNVLKATRLLTDEHGVGMSPKRITVSTSGIVPKIYELGEAEMRPKLAISLNASTEDQRQAPDAHYAQVSLAGPDGGVSRHIRCALGKS